jgi:hypothetical protein
VLRKDSEAERSPPQHVCTPGMSIGEVDLEVWRRFQGVRGFGMGEELT